MDFVLLIPPSGFTSHSFLTCLLYLNKQYFFFFLILVIPRWNTRLQQNFTSAIYPVQRFLFHSGKVSRKETASFLYGTIPGDLQSTLLSISLWILNSELVVHLRYDTTYRITFFVLSAVEWDCFIILQRSLLKDNIVKALVNESLYLCCNIFRNINVMW